jgi:hypothetical protein
MAMSILSSTIMLITLYEPNMRRAQKRVKLLMPVKSNAMRSTSPNDAQKRDCEVSNRLERNLFIF